MPKGSRNKTEAQSPTLRFLLSAGRAGRWPVSTVCPFPEFARNTLCARTVPFVGQPDSHFSEQGHKMMISLTSSLDHYPNSWACHTAGLGYNTVLLSQCSTCFLPFLPLPHLPLQSFWSQGHTPINFLHAKISSPILREHS